MSSSYLTPCLILLDGSALLAGRSQEWQIFARIGPCHIPQVIWEEIQYLGDRATDATLERAAREFLRFYPQSGWQTINTQADHPQLQPAAGAALSKKARLALAVAQTTYGFAISHTAALTILVTNDAGLLKQITTLHIPNLCGMPRSVWMQWIRTQRKPDVVLRHLHAMRIAPQTTEAIQSTQAKGRNSVAAPSPTGASLGWRSSDPVARRGAIPLTASARRYPLRPSLKRRIASVVTALMMLLGLAIAGMAIWRTLHPPSFNQFWRQIGAPLPLR
jgi:hypothetical protein